jgi:hypothetical protein
MSSNAFGQVNGEVFDALMTCIFTRLDSQFKAVRREFSDCDHFAVATECEYPRAIKFFDFYDALPNRHRRKRNAARAHETSGLLFKKF